MLLSTPSRESAAAVRESAAAVVNGQVSCFPSRFSSSSQVASCSLNVLDCFLDQISTFEALETYGASRGRSFLPLSSMLSSSTTSSSSSLEFPGSLLRELNLNPVLEPKQQQLPLSRSPTQFRENVQSVKIAQHSVFGQEAATEEEAVRDA